VIEVAAYGSFDIAPVASICGLRVQETVGASTVAQAQDGGLNGEEVTMSVYYVNTSPTPGTTYTYELQGSSVDGDDRCDSGGAEQEFGLMVKMYPAG
jgi:hypothetical protein